MNNLPENNQDLLDLSVISILDNKSTVIKQPDNSPELSTYEGNLKDIIDYHDSINPNT